ncbi:MAG: hypothetical protein QM778_30980 [Myxococcales bacterium]
MSREMLALSHRTNNRTLLLDALLWLGHDYVELGDAENMMRVRNEFVERVEQTPSPWHRYMAEGSRVLEASVYGDLAGARALSERLMGLGRQVQDDLAETFHLLRMLFFDVQQATFGPQPEVDPRQRLEVPAAVAADYHPFWALRWVTHGQLEAARALLQRTMQDQHRLLDVLRRPILCAMSVVAARLGEQELARELYGLLSPAAGRHMLLRACVYMGPVDHYLGVLAAALAQHEAAVGHFERALEIGMSPVLQIQTQQEFGRFLASSCDGPGHARERANKLLESSRQSAQLYGLMARGAAGALTSETVI